MITEQSPLNEPKPDMTLVKETVITQQKINQKGFHGPRATVMQYKKEN